MFENVKWQENGKLKLLIIVGNEETVAAMTRNDRRQRRYSGLKLRLEGKA